MSSHPLPRRGSPPFQEWVAFYAQSLALQGPDEAESFVASTAVNGHRVDAAEARSFAHDVRLDYEQQTRLIGRAIIHDPRDRVREPGALPLLRGVHWDNFRVRVETVLGEASFADVESDALEILSMLDPRGRPSPYPPHVEEAVDYRGLVIGQVQSGKTTSMQALMALAADNRYSLIIVLSGNTNILRAQTQARMEDQVLSRLPSLQIRWFELTHGPENADPNGDFGKLNPLRPRQVRSQLQSGNVVVAISKKNAYVLRTVERAVAIADEEGVRVLVIDDEADLASVDGNARTGREGSRTAINRAIGALIGRSNVAYVAYTATPFAILLSDPDRADGIFPRSFIWMLRTPRDYIGPERLFGEEGQEWQGDGLEEAPWDVLRSVEDDEIVAVRGAQHGLGVGSCPALERALSWFVVASACMWEESSGEPVDTTMLVHPSVSTDVHEHVKAYLVTAIEALRRSFASGEADLEEVFKSEDGRVLGGPARSWAVVKERIPVILEKMHVIVDNFRSTDRLNYGDGHTPAPIVVVGGNTLSRGVTLRGLVSSYIVRSVGAVDTLLQAGRWFGYRPGYMDLPRIWLPDDLRQDFREAATIEGHLRRQLQEYQAAPPPRPSPVDLPALMRSPRAMQLTGKMGYAATVTLNFSGAHNLYTTYLLRENPEALQHNIELLAGLLSGGVPKVDSNGGLQLADVPWATIERFLDPESGLQMWTGAGPWIGDTRSRLLDYIQQELGHDHLLLWDVNTVGRVRPGRTLALPNSNLELPLIVRSRMKAEDNPAQDDRVAYIKSLRSLADLGLGMPSAGQSWLKDRERLADLTAGDFVRARSLFREHVGLLNIYPIDKKSTPRDAGPRSRRVALDASEDVIGIDLILPECPQNKTVNYTINALLRPPFFIDEEATAADQEAEHADELDAQDEPVIDETA